MENVLWIMDKTVEKCFKRMKKQEIGANPAFKGVNFIHKSVENLEKARHYLPFTVLIISLICKEKAELVSTNCSIFLMEW